MTERPGAAPEVPIKVRRLAEQLGAPGRAWLEALPGQIAALERDWGIAVGAAAGRGSEAFVAFARASDGAEAALKISIPGLDPARLELRTLRAAGGAGYAKLLRADEAANVMLLERLGPQLAESDLPIDDQLGVICATLSQAWRCPPPLDGVPTGAEKAAELAAAIERTWGELAGPCPARTVERALDCAERRRRAFDPALAVPVHGDAHQWNTLRAPGSPSGYKFVDPDGGFAEPAYDLAISMREWTELPAAGDRLALGEARCTLLSAATGAPWDAIWEWGVVQCVANGLSLKRLGMDEGAAIQLGMANAWMAD